MLADERFRCEESDHVVEQLIGFEHPAVTGLTAGLKAAADAENRCAVVAELLQVALRCRVREHFAVHCRRQQQRHVGNRPRQAQQAQQVVSPAVQQLCDEVGAARRDQDRIGLARQVDVRHVVGYLTGRAAVPLAGKNRTPAERLHRHRRDELRGRLGHHDLHCRAGLDQRAAQLGAFVAGDAAGQAQHDMPAGQFKRLRVLETGARGGCVIAHESQCISSPNRFRSAKPSPYNQNFPPGRTCSSRPT